MNLSQMEKTIRLIVKDPLLEDVFRQWINDAIASIAYDWDLPSLQTLEPVDFPVVATTWLYDAPADYHKTLYKAQDSDTNPIWVAPRWGHLQKQDHTLTGDHVKIVAAHDMGDVKKIGIWPMAAETIQIWYYQKPSVLSEPNDTCTCIPAEYHEDVIIARAVTRNFQYLQDMAENPPMNSLMYWENRFREGMFGTPMGRPGFIRLIGKFNPPERLGGADPLP